MCECHKYKNVLRECEDLLNALRSRLPIDNNFVLFDQIDEVLEHIDEVL